MITIKTKVYAGRTISLPEVGVTTISEEGTFTVKTQEQADILCSILSCDFEVVNIDYDIKTLATGTATVLETKTGKETPIIPISVVQETVVQNADSDTADNTAQVSESDEDKEAKIASADFFREIIYARVQGALAFNPLEAIQS
jgi:hypothetical protein